MKILQSQQSLNKISSSSGFLISFFIHSALLVALFYAPPFLELKPTENKTIKIDLKSFEPIAAPVFAPEPIPAPPAPPAPTPPKPTPPEPVAIPPEPTPPPKPKPEPKPKPIDQLKPEPVPQPQPPTPPVSTPTSVSMPAPATSTATAAPAKQATAPVIGEYNMQNSAGDKNFDQIRRALIKHHKYPKNAIKMRKQGVCEVRFLLKSNGDVTNIEVINSSGTQILDDSAVDTVKRAATDFPKLPNDVRVRIPITFKLN